ncbi:MAG TPA: FABP family protein [Tessaracoccus flavescens]|uniref:Peroxynitrite isomerase n=1 Tax=Tessaracoccus flavescens TaxID=399497 RepID=A0A921JQZ5_9ACTN|nr:FABP family protein [Tessaracoccus flavescens]
MNLDDIEVPEGLNPALRALGWMVGRWEGTGNGQDHEGNDFEFEQRIEFSHNGGDYLYYASQTFKLGEEGAEQVPLGMETGFWRPKADATIEVFLASADGWAEALTGRIQVTRIDLMTQQGTVVRTNAAAVGYNAGTRLYGQVEGDLMYALDRETDDHEMRPHMWARLKRV